MTYMRSNVCHSFKFRMLEHFEIIVYGVLIFRALGFGVYFPIV